MRLRPVLLVGFTMLLLVANACDGCPGARPVSCSADGDCQSGESCTEGSCQQGAGNSTSGQASGSTSGGLGTYCDSDAECKEDEFCNAAGHLCVSRHDCDTEADCDPGQVCRDFDGDTYRDCGYEGCANDAECVGEVTCEAAHRPRCVARACVCEHACGGTGECPGDGRCCGIPGPCVTVNNEDACCITDPGPCPNQNCQPGFEPVASSATWSVDLCAYETNANTCTCTELPPLDQGTIGNPNAIGTDGAGRLYVLAYNKTYGDVMLGEGPASGGDITWRFLDGVPLGAAVVAGPSGPRGGVAEPGPDMGRYLDLAVTTSGIVHAVYQDATAGTLRYARVESGNTTRFTLDPDRETGVYVSIALDPSDNAPRIAYLTRRDDSDGTPVARLKLAVARNSTPGGASDFVVHTLKEVDLATQACEGKCPTGQRCETAEAPVIPACVDELPAGDCTPSCGTGEFCSATGCLVEHAGSNLQDIPQGPGIWSAMTVRADGKPVVVAYDTFTADLLAFTTQGGDPPESEQARFEEVLLDGDVDDAGEWPSIVSGPSGNVHVVYVHGTSHALMHQELGANLQIVAEEVIDDAARVEDSASSFHRFADTAVARRTDGALIVVYQDGTTGELLMAVQNGAAWDLSTLAGGADPAFNGYYGFSNDAVSKGAGAPLISTARKLPNTAAGVPEYELHFFNWP